MVPHYKTQAATTPAKTMPHYRQITLELSDKQFSATFANLKAAKRSHVRVVLIIIMPSKCKIWTCYVETHICTMCTWLSGMWGCCAARHLDRFSWHQSCLAFMPEQMPMCLFPSKSSHREPYKTETGEEESQRLCNVTWESASLSASACRGILKMTASASATPAWKTKHSSKVWNDKPAVMQKDLCWVQGTQNCLCHPA